MNSKKTNRLVSILNIIFVLSLYCLLPFLFDCCSSYIITDKSIYNSIIVDFLVSNIELIILILCIVIGLLNIICAIQNRKNKKICFWQIVFVFYELIFVFEEMDLLNIFEYYETANKLLFCIIPIILAIINLLLIKKKKPNTVQINSYIVVIILSVFIFSERIEPELYWYAIIASIIILIYVHFQEKTIVETKKRKTINILLYYILQMILTIGFLTLIISSLIINKIHSSELNTQMSELCNKIYYLEDIKNPEIYIPVNNNNKYGFINLNGAEKIPCEYDKISNFVNSTINNQTCYFALVKKEKNYYIISKNNEKIDISNNKYLINAYNIIFDKSRPNDILLNIDRFNNTFNKFLGKKISASLQKINGYSYNTIILQKEGSKSYYTNDNYTMIIENIEDETKNNSTSKTQNSISYESPEPKYKVTIRKGYSEENSSIYYLPLYNSNYNSFITYSDGSIPFKSLDNKDGFFDKNGNQFLIPDEYQIVEIFDSKIVLTKNDKESYLFTFFILDKSMHLLLKSNSFSVFNNMLLLKTENNKIALYNQELNRVSEEYDAIIPNIMDSIYPFNSF